VRPYLKNKDKRATSCDRVLSQALASILVHKKTKQNKTKQKPRTKQSHTSVHLPGTAVGTSDRWATARWKNLGVSDVILRVGGG
jgi:hypothetical protein